MNLIDAFVIPGDDKNENECKSEQQKCYDQKNHDGHEESPAQIAVLLKEKVRRESTNGDCKRRQVLDIFIPSPTGLIKTCLGGGLFGLLF